MMWKIFPLVVALFGVGLGSSRPGSVTDIDKNNPDFQRAVRFAVTEYNSNSHDKCIYKVERVLKAQSQVVAGVNYIMTLKLSKTSCLKSSHKRFCPITKRPCNAKFIVCTFTVWYRSWLNNMRLVGSKCKKERTTWD